MFFSGDLRAALGNYDATADLASGLPAEFARWHPLHQAQYLETTFLLPGYILSSQGDRMGMASSVEGRFPFLDHRVAALAAKMPPRYKMRVLDEKHVLKRATADLVPAFLADRPKQPYRAPEASSFFAGDGSAARFPWIEEVLSPRALSAAGIFNPAAVSLLVAKARAGRVIGLRDGMSLVAVLSTQLVHSQFVDNLERMT